MRSGRSLLFIGVGGLMLAVLPAGVASAATCTGNKLVQQAPYTCTASRTNQGITVLVTLSVDANGRAVANFSLPAPAPVAVPLAMHSWMGIDTGPAIVQTGSIPVGATTGQLMIEQIQCGQLDIKAVDTTPGSPNGILAGPVIHWGEECQTMPTTVPTTAAPTSVAPTSVAPTSVATTSVAPPTSNTVLPTSIARSTTAAVSPTSVGPATTNAVLPTSFPNTATGAIANTGVNLVTPAMWALLAIGAGAGLVLVARRWRAEAG